MNTTRLLIAAALLTSVSLPALAASTEDVNDKKAVCAKQLAENQDLITKLRNARPSKVNQQALIDAALKVNPGAPICLADLLGEGDDDIAELLAPKVSDVNDNVDPAAGGDDETPGDLGGTTDGAAPGGENPNQLNTPTPPSNPPASPSAPRNE